MRSRFVAVALAVALLAGCSASENGPIDPAGTGTGTVDDRPLSELAVDADPRAIEGPSTARLVAEAVEPVAEDPEQDLPATVTSADRGGDIEVTVSSANRVLALSVSGSVSSTVLGLGLGDRLVGRDSSTVFRGSDDLPLVTRDGHSLNGEAVLDLDPDLVITDGSVGPRDVVEQLRDAGVTVVFVDGDPSFEGAARMARQIGAALGVPVTGEELAQRITDEVAEVGDEVARLVPEDPADQVSIVFLYLRGTAGVYYLFGEESGASDLIRGLGARDLATELGWKDSQPLTDEAILEADPDLILVMTHGIESTGGIDGLLQAKPAIALTAAGQKKRFVDMADTDILSFGPRSAGVLEALVRAVYDPLEGS